MRSARTLTTTSGGLIRLLEYFRNHRGRAMTFLGLAAYVVSPLDLLPEAFLGPIGLVDDFYAIFMIAQYVYPTLKDILMPQLEQALRNGQTQRRRRGTRV